jgi:sensor histidine kinase YesM
VGIFFAVKFGFCSVCKYQKKRKAIWCIFVLVENKNRNKRIMFWVSQLVGWAVFFGIGFSFTEKTPDYNASQDLLRITTLYLAAIGVISIYRFVIIKFRLLEVKQFSLLVLVFPVSFLLGATLLTLSIFSKELFLEASIWKDIRVTEFLFISFLYSFVFLAWNLLYYIYYLVESNRDREIKNLQWEATKNESELNNLKAQLNPHFMFNSMNSIRALIDEDPKKAKTAVTQLSTILRNTLLMGKRKLVTIGEELSIVEDYLSLEAIRYEERLRVRIDIPENVKSYTIPPLTLQTLVENAIKHGIANYAKGGDLVINTSECKEEVCIHLENPGKLKGVNQGTGTGLKNAHQRLKLLFGEEADILLTENLEKVTTLVKIPKKTLNESSSNR